MTKIFVRDLMSGNVLSLRPEDQLEEARELMWRHHVRHLPVVDEDGTVVGMISHRDLLSANHMVGPDPQAAGFSPLALPVREVMSRQVAITEADRDIREAAQMMFEGKIGCLPVLDAGRLIGILTESDFVRFLARGN